MLQVSTNLTLGLRLFVPILLGVFFGAITLFFWVADRAFYSNMPGPTVRLAVTGLYLAMLALFAVSLWRLRRVEMGPKWVYVTDYFRQARYPWSNVAALRERRLGRFSLVRVEFHEPGSFGRYARFLASTSRWQLFKAENPERAAELLR